MQCFSYGQTPQTAILAACNDEPYHCCLSSGDEAVVKRVIDIGIDSYLEAVFFTQSRDKYGKLKLAIEAKSMPCLLRRLLEDGSERAMDLRSSILSSLDIEEV